MCSCWLARELGKNRVASRARGRGFVSTEAIRQRRADPVEQGLHRSRIDNVLVLDDFERVTKLMCDEREQLIGRYSHARIAVTL